MRIGEVAERTGLNISNIRFYERKGLLMPDRKEESKYRDYTQEDVLRIKRILLYRKMGVSVETIYLILQEQADVHEVLKRQKEELVAQMENLQGAMELCDLVMQEDRIDPEKLDMYLSYIHQEETRGKQFAEVTELLDEMVDYTRTGVFHLNPMMVGVFQHSWAGRLISVGFLLLLLALPIEHLYEVYIGDKALSLALLLVYGAGILLYVVGFLIYHKNRRN